MAKQLDHILVIDVESTCWKGKPPKGQISEIIEIGICLVDLARLQRLEKYSILVKPQRSEISAFCTELTTLTPEMFTQANRFHEAALILKAAYHSKERPWASWGAYDRRQFERVCQLYDVGYPFGPRHLNLKTLFAVAMGLPHEIGMAAACRKIGLTLEGTHHRGVDDAWNIAAILCFLLKQMRGE